MNSTTEKLPTKNLNAISEVLVDLQNRGFSYLFKLKDECISCKDYTITFEEFDVLEAHNFAEDYVLYAIKCAKYNIKGVIIIQRGTYSDVFSSVCISKILNNNEIKLNVIAEM